MAFCLQIAVSTFSHPGQPDVSRQMQSHLCIKLTLSRSFSIQAEI